MRNCGYFTPISGDISLLLITARRPEKYYSNWIMSPGIGVNIKNI